MVVGVVLGCVLLKQRERQKQKWPPCAHGQKKSRLSLCVWWSFSKKSSPHHTKQSKRWYLWETVNFQRLLQTVIMFLYNNGFGIWTEKLYKNWYTFSVSSQNQICKVTPTVGVSLLIFIIGTSAKCFHASESHKQDLQCLRSRLQRRYASWTLRESYFEVWRLSTSFNGG